MGKDTCASEGGAGRVELEKRGEMLTFANLTR